MAAPKGNQFWKARSKHGRDKIWTDPHVLREACEEYFQWVEDNPLQEAKPFAYEGVVTIENVNKLRAMTLGSLCLFLDIDQSTWIEYRKHKDFSDVCSRVETAIREQKFGGAAAGLLNPAIIARDLGLADKRELSAPGGGPIQTDNTHRVDPTQLREMMKQLDDEC